LGQRRRARPGAGNRRGRRGLGPGRRDVGQPPCACSLTRIDGFHLAQLNIALPQAPIDTPQLAEFVALLEPVNALADGTPGFIWRLQDDSGDATSIKAFGDDRLIVNMSLWEDLDALWRFVYDGGHLEVMRRRREWFERVAVHLVLWWVPAGTLPTVEDAELRLAALEEHGPTPYAFTFKAPFSAVAVEAVPGLAAELPLCDQLS
jgi:hypothetical protein